MAHLKIKTQSRGYTLHMGKYYCMADPQFYLFRFICFVNVELETGLLVWLNPNQANNRSFL